MDFKRSPTDALLIIKKNNNNKKLIEVEVKELIPGDLLYRENA